MGKPRVFLFGLFLLLASGARADRPPAPRGDDPTPAGRAVNFQVVERKTNRPLAGIAITTVSFREGVKEFRGTTDSQGRCIVPISPSPDRSGPIEVQAWKDGFVPIRVRFGGDAKGRGVPDTYTLTIDPGVSIGGVVRDEQGRPVAGARVFPSLGGQRSALEYLGLPDDWGFETDAEGRWRCAILPESRESGDLFFRVSHPGFVSKRNTPDRTSSIKDLRAMKGVIVLQTGFTVTGRVTDDKGKPIEGASVIFWDAVDDSGLDLVLMGVPTQVELDAEVSRSGIRRKTGAGGRFRFENCPPGIQMITVEMPGLAPGVKEIRLGTPDPGPEPPLPVDAQAVTDDADVTQLAKVGPCVPPLEFRLGSGRTIHGRVVYAQGKPVAGAVVIPEIRMVGLDRLGWHGVTAADGRFEWTHAPIEALTLRVGDPAAGRWVEREVGPDDADVVVTMPTPFRLRVTVVDSETGRSIDRFRITPGTAWTNELMTGGAAPPDDDGLPTWRRAETQARTDGRFETRFPLLPIVPQESYYLVLRVEAEGYARALSRKFRVDDSELNYQFSLYKRAWIEGTIHSPEGSPVSGAKVFLATKGEPELSIYNGQAAETWQGDRVTTGPDGRFAFAAPEQRCRIVAVSERGVASRSVEELAARPIVKLVTWGRIEGQLRIGAGPGVDQLIGATVSSVEAALEPRVWFTCRIPTDSRGHFLLERVTPGRASVYRPHWFADGTSVRSQRVWVEVGPGQTSNVTIGGTGRAVVGRVTVANDLAPIELDQLDGRIRLLPPDPQFPTGYDDWDRKRRATWWKAFYTTEEGRKYSEQSNLFAVRVASDGSFRVEDLPAGDYRLDLIYRNQSVEFLAEGLKTVSSLAAECLTLFEIPPGSDGKPLDLGVVTLQRVKEPTGGP